MKTRLHLSFQKGDLLAIILVAFIASAVFAGFAFLNLSQEDRVLQVYQDGRLIKELSLENDIVLKVDGEYRNTISIQDGSAAITASDCPGEDCVHSGWISSSGRSVVCLPNRVEIRIVGAESEVDFVVG